MLGAIKIKFLMLEKRFHYGNGPAGLLVSAFVIGLSFAFGWTPGLGPILAGILTLASSQETIYDGVKLLLVYSLSLGIPFLISGITTNYFSEKYSRGSR